MRLDIIGDKFPFFSPRPNTNTMQQPNAMLYRRAIIMHILTCALFYASSIHAGPVNIVVPETNNSSTTNNADFELKNPGQNIFAYPDKIIDVKDILSTNTKMRDMVDRYISPEESKQQQARALYNLMFSPDKFSLQYDSSQTKTAIETIESGSGNCLSLANAFVAMARYAGLNAYYLDVEVDDNWQMEEDIYYQMKHTSAAVKTTRKKYLGIEFAWRGPASKAKSKIIKDNRAFAAFYSNRGVELLMRNKLAPAVANLEQAISVDPTDTYSWSNLGIAYKRLDRLKDAEIAYRHALRNNRYDLTVLNNLSILYKKMGNPELAERYQQKLEHYRLKNPYYLIKLAEKAIETNDYETAIEYAQKAIQKNSEEHEFYFIAAKAYIYMGNRDAVIANLEKAKEYSDKAIYKQRYNRQADLLRELDIEDTSL